MSTKKTDKPTSQAKIAANQANAQKSTGPTSPEGKECSRANALRHGLLAGVVIIRDDPAEDCEGFYEVLKLLTAEYQPIGPTQCLLVERIAVCYWRLRRALRFEAQCIHNDRHVGRCVGPHEGIIYSPYDSEGSRGVIPAGRDFDRLTRYETMIDRQLNKLMDRLDHLRKTQPADDPNWPRYPSPPECPKPPPDPGPYKEPWDDPDDDLDHFDGDDVLDDPIVKGPVGQALTRYLESLGLYDEPPKGSTPPKKAKKAPGKAKKAPNKVADKAPASSYDRPTCLPSLRVSESPCLRVFFPVPVPPRLLRPRPHGGAKRQTNPNSTPQNRPTPKSGHPRWP